jgi:DNA-binding transcriptional ArsR family regulator
MEKREDLEHKKRDNLVVLSPDEEMYLDNPYGGLFGDTVIAKVVEELVADPTMDYRPKYLADVCGKSEGSIYEVLKKLVKLGLIEKSLEGKHPVYRVRVESKKFAALSFLAYAMLDDRFGTDCMDGALSDYYHSKLRGRDEPGAIATADTWKTEPGIITGEYGEKRIISASA